MISILLHMLLTPYAIFGIVALVLLGAGIWFTLGPATLIKLATDIRTWFAIAAVLAVLAFAHGEKQNADLHKRLDTLEQQGTADVDATKTTELRMEQKSKRAAENTRVRVALAKAKPADAEDAVMDAIAAERGDPIAGMAPAKTIPPKAVPPLVTETAKVKKKPPENTNVALPAPQVAAPTDRAAGAAGNGLRKRPDVVVVP